MTKGNDWEDVAASAASMLSGLTELTGATRMDKAPENETEEAKAAREAAHEERWTQEQIKSRRRELRVGRATLDEVLADNKDPRVLEDIRSRYEAEGKGWFGAYVGEVYGSPGYWVHAMKDALEVAGNASGLINPATRATLIEWINDGAIEAFRKSTAK